MNPVHVVTLVVAGIGGGFVAGLVGVGGGIVFAPVLFYYFQSAGVAPEHLAPMTVGTSLLCTLIASAMSGWQHHLKASVSWQVSLRVGFLSAAAMYVVLTFVTTQSWYDRLAFQLVFGLLLIAVAGQMILRTRAEVESTTENSVAAARHSTFTLGAIGTAAGTIAGLAGVGGGIVMVPAFHRILRLPMRVSVGTSSGAIVVISLIGVVGYALSGWTESNGSWTLGYVDVAHGLILALPSLFGARTGARLAHRLPKRALQLTFAAMACAVAGRMLWSALSGQ